jgi:riboflavin synthase alpha subunit
MGATKLTDMTMKTIKIGRKTYEIKPGDYILDNGACLQFVAGDKRGLKFGYNNIVMPKSVAKKIQFSDMRKETVVKMGSEYTYYFF